MSQAEEEEQWMDDAMTHLRREYPFGVDMPEVRKLTSELLTVCGELSSGHHTDFARYAISTHLHERPMDARGTLSLLLAAGGASAQLHLPARYEDYDKAQDCIKYADKAPFFHFTDENGGERVIVSSAIIQAVWTPEVEEEGAPHA